jgi:hypothetical protein
MSMIRGFPGKFLRRGRERDVLGRGRFLGGREDVDILLILMGVVVES